MKTKTCMGIGPNGSHRVCDCKRESMEAIVRAAEALVGSFNRMKEDHYEKLVLHQTLETASDNWDKLLQEPLEFGPLIQALETYKARSAT